MYQRAHHSAVPEDIFLLPLAFTCELQGLILLFRLAKLKHKLIFRFKRPHCNSLYLMGTSLSQRTMHICFSTSYILHRSLSQITLHILFSLHALCSYHSSGCLRVSHSSAAAIPSLIHLKAFCSSRIAQLTQLCKHQLSSLTTEIVNQVRY